MFFDNDYAGTTLLDDYVKVFIYRRRLFQAPPPGIPIGVDEASRIFCLEKEDLKTMTKRRLTRIFRRLAQKRYPDKGGSKEQFVELTDSYQRLLRNIKRSN